MRPYPTATQPQFKLNHKKRSAGSSANHAKRIGRTQPRRARGGASALDNLGSICAQLPTGAGGSPSALRLRGATRKATRPCAAHGRTSAQLSATSTPIQPLYNRFPTPHQPFSNRRAEPIIRVPCATQKAFRRRLRPSSQHHAPHPERRRIGSEVVMLPSGSCQTSVPFST